MKIIKEFEVIGINEVDDEEWCASCNDIQEAYHYMTVYVQDYVAVELYEVSKCKIKTLQNSNNLEEEDE